MSNKAQLIRKLKLQKENPELIKDLTPNELADLVLIVLTAVEQIETSIETKSVDIDSKFSQKATEVLAKAEQDTAATLQTVTNEVNRLIADGNAKVSQTASQLEKQVQTALENIRNGDDGIVTEAEIERAASMALSMIKLPDFDAMMGEALTTDGESIRNALELLSGEDRYSVEIADVTGLADALNKLAQVRSESGGTIGKQQVYSFIRNAITDGIIASSIETLDDIGDVAVTAVADGEVVTWSDSENKWINAAPPGASGGEANTASNVGTAGVGVFKGKSLLDLQFKKLNAGSSKITITDDTGNDEVDIDLGTVAAADISDFDIEVANNTAVAANTAKVTANTANVTAAGALMESEVTNLAQVKAFDPADYATAAQGTTADAAPTISSGAGAPGSTPTKVGDIYIDTTGDDAYIAVGTASSSDWEISNDGAGGGISDGDKGDITVSSSGATWTIDDEAVTLAKMAHVATNRVLARSTSGTGVVEALTLPNFRTLINVEDGADVTSTAKVEAAGALMDSEVTNLAQVKAFDSSDYATAAHTHLLAAGATDVTASAAEVNVLDGITATTAELNILDGIAAKTGSDTSIVTGTAGTSGNVATWDANGDLVDSGVAPATLSSTINFIIDGGGSAITTGIKGDIQIDFDCTINSVTLLADQSGSIVVDIWNDTYANYPATDADSITASAVPTISTATKSTDATLTGWTTTISAGDILRFNVDSITTCTRVTLALKVTRT